MQFLINEKKKIIIIIIKIRIRIKIKNKENLSFYWPFMVVWY